MTEEEYKITDYTKLVGGFWEMAMHSRDGKYYRIIMEEGPELRSFEGNSVYNDNTKAYLET